MNFHRYGYSFIDCTKIGNNSKRTKTSRNEVIQPSTRNNDQLFLNHVHSQAGFGKPVIKAGGFINLGISKIVFTF